MLNIGQFAEATGLSAHTLRYYEKINLLSPVLRDNSGHRRYSQKDRDWVAFITRLKQTSMPLKEIKKYAVLRAEGGVTLASRKALLEAHAVFIADKIVQEKAHLVALEKKIAWYEEQLSL